MLPFPVTRLMIAIWMWADTFHYIDAQFGSGPSINIDADLTQTQSNEDMAKDFLFLYGYADSETPTDAEYSASLRAFQTFYGLPVTGTLSTADMDQVRLSRCGNADVEHSTPRFEVFHDVNTDVNELVGQFLGPIRSKRDAASIHGHNHSLFSCPPPKQVYTWCLRNCVNDFCDSAGMRNVITRSFDWYGSVAGLTIEEIRCPGQAGFWFDECKDVALCESADFVIAFAGIDGAGQQLGFACPWTNQNLSPVCPGTGWVVLDGMEGQCPDGSSRWTLEKTVCPNTDCGYSFMTVLIHEIGHVLGFEHEPNTGACAGSIMNPFYRCATATLAMNQCTNDQLKHCFVPDCSSIPHSMATACGSGCEENCAKLPVLPANCTLPCVPKCECEPGYVMKEGVCVTEVSCPVACLDPTEVLT